MRKKAQHTFTVQIRDKARRKARKANEEKEVKVDQDLLEGLYCQIEKRISQHTAFNPHTLTELLLMLEHNTDGAFILLAQYLRKFSKDCLNDVYQKVKTMTSDNQNYALLVMMVIKLKPRYCESMFEKIVSFSKSEHPKILWYFMEILCIMLKNQYFELVWSIKPLKRIIEKQLDNPDLDVRDRCSKVLLYLLREDSTRLSICIPKLFQRFSQLLLTCSPYKNDIWLVLKLLFEDSDAQCESKKSMQVFLFYLNTEKDPKIFKTLCKAFVSIAERRSTSYIVQCCGFGLFQIAGNRLKASTQESEQLHLLRIVSAFFSRLRLDSQKENDDDDTKNTFKKSIEQFERVPCMRSFLELLYQSENFELSGLASIALGFIVFEGE